MNTISQAIKAFCSAISATGLIPPASVISDGKIHRFSSNRKNNDDAGWYVFHSDDPLGGAFGCWRSGVNETWHANGPALTESDRQQLLARLDMVRTQREAEARKRRTEAAERARKLWDRGELVDCNN